MTVSRGTYVSAMLALARLRTVAHDPAVRYPCVELPAAAAGADAVLLSSEPFPFKQRHADQIRARVGSDLPIVPIDGEMTSWYGSRAVAGLDYLGDFARELAQRLSMATGSISSAGSKPKMRP